MSYISFYNVQGSCKPFQQNQRDNSNQQGEFYYFISLKKMFQYVYLIKM